MELTKLQEDELRRLKAYFPFRPVVFGTINPETNEFQCHANYNKRKMNNFLRKGWVVFSI